MKDTNYTLEALHALVAQCDSHHHHYHYQSSWQHLCLAETFRALGQEEEALAHYKAALFQDHQNLFAKRGPGMHSVASTLPPYERRTRFDSVFRSAIGEPATEATRWHDAGVAALECGYMDRALTCFDKAILAEPDHGNSFCARGQAWFAQGDMQKACADFTEAVRLFALRHDAYHRFASGMHLKRGQCFLRAGEVELAINDFSKALDLDRHNIEALEARMNAYAQKSNEAMAEDDRQQLQGLRKVG